MYKKILGVALITYATGASAFFGSNNYGGYNNNGFFGFNPYSFMEPKWFIQEAENFINEFDNDNYYRGYRYPNTYTIGNFRDNPNYKTNYMIGYSKYYK